MWKLLHIWFLGIIIFSHYFIDFKMSGLFILLFIAFVQACTDDFVIAGFQEIHQACCWMGAEWFAFLTIKVSSVRALFRRVGDVVTCEEVWWWVMKRLLLDNRSRRYRYSWCLIFPLLLNRGDPTHTNDFHSSLMLQEVGWCLMQSQRTASSTPNLLANQSTTFFSSSR